MISKIYIIGFAKCGSTSLRTYLRNMFHGVVSVQSFPGISLHHPNWKRHMLGTCQDQRVLPVIIIRNPFERIWSAYWWSKKWGRDISFEGFLARKSCRGNTLSNGEDTDKSAGIDNPVEACNYWKFIDQAKECNPLVLRFEDMIKIPTFPHEAKTSEMRVGDKRFRRPPLDNQSRQLIKEAFDKEGIPYEQY